MTIDEVAKYLRLHRSTVYRLVREGIIPGFKVGSQWRFHQGRVEQWMARKEADVAAPEREVP
jgi:excisionase family DNA binding protein